MRAINSASARILETLTAGLAIGEARKFNNAPGTFLPACIERIMLRNIRDQQGVKPAKRAA